MGLDKDLIRVNAFYFGGNTGKVLVNGHCTQSTKKRSDLIQLSNLEESCLRDHISLISLDQFCLLENQLKSNEYSLGFIDLDYCSSLRLPPHISSGLELGNYIRYLSSNQKLSLLALSTENLLIERILEVYNGFLKKPFDYNSFIDVVNPLLPRN